MMCNVYMQFPFNNYVGTYGTFYLHIRSSALTIYVSIVRLAHLTYICVPVVGELVSHH